jgi:hypothetical protein
VGNSSRGITIDPSADRVAYYEQGANRTCRAYLARLRWPEGFRCPRCGGGRSWPVRGVLLECAGCGCQTSVTAGTIFQDTRTPLPVWFRAMWWVATQKNGGSALGLQRVLGLKSYETAWTWLHKFRRAMVRPGRDRLTGRVEVDECYVGGLEEGLPGRLNLEKALVVVAAQEDGPGIGRIRMRQIIDASAESLVPFVQDSVEPGSIIHTDGWLGYLPLEKKGYDHEVTFLKGKKKTASQSMPRVHRVIALLEPVSLDHILHPEAKSKTKPQPVGASRRKYMQDVDRKGKRDLEIGEVCMTEKRRA